MEFPNRYKPVRLYYEKYVPDNCNSDLPAIIFLHGLTTSHNSWNRVKSKIAKNTQRKVYVIDLRNHGKSEWSDDVSLNFLVADLENFIIQENLKKPILVGHSVGGRVALCLALQKPEMVSKIVVEECKVKNPEKEDVQMFVKLAKSAKQIRNLPASLSMREADDIISTMVLTCLPQVTAFSEYAAFQAIRKGDDGKFYFDFNIDALEKSFDESHSYDINFKECQKFPDSALFIYSVKSLMKVQEDELIPEYFPRVQFCGFDINGHTLHIEIADEYIKTVSEFINNV